MEPKTKTGQPAGQAETPEQTIARLQAENEALKAQQNSGYAMKARLFVRQDGAVSYGVNIGYPSSLTKGAAEAVVANLDGLKAAMAEGERLLADPAKVAEAVAAKAKRQAEKAGK